MGDVPVIFDNEGCPYCGGVTWVDCWACDPTDPDHECDECLGYGGWYDECEDCFARPFEDYDPIEEAE